MALAKKIGKVAVCRRQLLRLHRQPHARGTTARVRLPAGGRRDAVAGRPRRCGLRLRRWARSGCATSPASTSAGASASAARAARPRAALFADRRPALRAGPLRPEDRRAATTATSGRATRSPIRWSSAHRARVRASCGIERRAGQRRGDRRARADRDGQRGRARSSRKASRCAPSDIDVIYVHGYGFPRYRGGPMYWAARQGWPQIHDTVQRLHASQGALWAPAPRLADLARQGRMIGGA